MNLLVFDAVDDVGPAFPDFIDLGDFQAVLLQERGGAGGGLEVEAFRGKALSHGQGRGLVRVLDAEEYAAF